MEQSYKDSIKGLTEEELYDKIKDTVYSFDSSPNFSLLPKDLDGNEVTLEQLYDLRDRGIKAGVMINNIYTGVLGAIDYLEALDAELKKSILIKEEEEKMWYGSPEQKQAMLDKFDKEFMLQETGQKKIRKNGNCRKKTKGRRRK